ncbi:putative polyol transporter 6 [Cladobotryum mycophilum]|uniref:Polyol transporter 6 n=1 Tax=Cladobotryum mycophilum TaxID=491253 RepID=A0ABR0SG26_9HYPO
MENLSAIFENPLKRFSKDELLTEVDEFCRKYNLTDHLDDFRKGALVAQNPETFRLIEELSPEDRNIIEREHTHRWSQPFMLYWLCVMCSLAAAVQGMNETVNNGAQALYLKDLGIAGDGITRFSQKMQDDLTGLIVGAPYLCCAILGCWLTEPLNEVLGRRGTIFVSCVIAAVASIWEAVANSWVNLFIARFVLGLGIGPKSSTVPVYAAECSPAPIRGALVMQWQMWTAFGIMLGNVMGVAFGPSTGIKESLGWRLMLGSTVVLPLLVLNIIAYYSTTIFIDSGYSTNSALLASMGTGILNFVFAIPALFTIDRWGRRNLLLFTFPFIAITLLWTGMSFFIPESDGKKRVAMVTTGMYLFEVFYSPGEGPVPFTYSAEAFPVHVRDVGMSFATATTWCFNFVISFSWTALQRAFTSQGAFGWYAAWCVILWFLILLYVPETKALTLEELDQVFSVSTRKHASYQIKNALWHFRVWVLRQKLEPLPPFYRQAEKLNT